MTGPQVSRQCERIIALQRELTDAIDDTDCTWGEAVGCVGFALAVLIDMQEDDAVRMAMARRVADKLVDGAWMRGSFGERERMQ